VKSCKVSYTKFLKRVLTVARLGDKSLFQPKLTLLLRDGLAVDATLSPDTRKFLEKLVSQQRPGVATLDGERSMRLVPIIE
jgi:hypothetical protein